jgi:glycogen operon protein
MNPVALPGTEFPLGAIPTAGGTNFAVASAADGVLLCLFDSQGTETQIPLRERDGGVWHGFVAGVGPGQAYGYRTTGPYDPRRGLRCNPAKLLLDPYARAIEGVVRFGPEVLGHAIDDPDAPSTVDSASHVPRSLVVDSSFGWSDGPGPTVATPTPSSTNSTSRASPRPIPRCPNSCRAPTPGWPTTPPSRIWSTWA